MSREARLNSALFALYAPSALPPSRQETERLLATLTYLLRELNHPQNLSILVSNICSSPVLWESPSVVHTSKRVVSCFAFAVRAVRERNKAQRAAEGPTNHAQPIDGNVSIQTLTTREWLRAVEEGLHNCCASPRRPNAPKNEWKACVVYAGLAFGFSMAPASTGDARSKQDNRSGGAQRVIDSLVTRCMELANVVVDQAPNYPTFASHACIVALAYLPLSMVKTPPPASRGQYVLPVLEAMLGDEGLAEGAALAVPRDATTGLDGLISWPHDCPEFLAWKEQAGRPFLALIANLASLETWLIRHTARAELGRLVPIVSRMLRFTDSAQACWARSIFREVEPKQPGRYMTSGTYERAWKLVDDQLTLLSIAIIGPLHQLVGRLVTNTTHFNSDMARHVIHILHNFSFAAQGRISSSSFFIFTLDAAVDRLATAPTLCNTILRDLAPPAQLPPQLSRMWRTRAIFFFGFIEALGKAGAFPAGIDTALIYHLALCYTSREVGVLLNSPALQGSGLELWEAAHVALLGTVAGATTTISSPTTSSCPAVSLPSANATQSLTSWLDRLLGRESTTALPVPLGTAVEDTRHLMQRYLPELIDSHGAGLVKDHQLVLGFKTLVQTSCPPSPIADVAPNLADQMMEVMRIAALNGTTHSSAENKDSDGVPGLPREALAALNDGEDASENESKKKRRRRRRRRMSNVDAGCVRALVEALPFLPHESLPGWLDETWALVQRIVAAGGAGRWEVRERFMRGLTEMDPSRSNICCDWWMGRACIPPRL